jgi:hypothetical protein
VCNRLDLHERSGIKQAAEHRRTRWVGLVDIRAVAGVEVGIGTPIGEDVVRAENGARCKTNRCKQGTRRCSLLPQPLGPDGIPQESDAMLVSHKARRENF